MLNHYQSDDFNPLAGKRSVETRSLCSFRHIFKAQQAEVERQRAETERQQAEVERQQVELKLRQTVLRLHEMGMAIGQITEITGLTEREARTIVEASAP